MAVINFQHEGAVSGKITLDQPFGESGLMIVENAISQLEEMREFFLESKREHRELQGSKP